MPRCELEIFPKSGRQENDTAAVVQWDPKLYVPNNEMLIEED